MNVEKIILKIIKLIIVLYARSTLFLIVICPSMFAMIYHQLGHSTTAAISRVTYIPLLSLVPSLDGLERKNRYAPQIIFATASATYSQRIEISPNT